MKKDNLYALILAGGVGSRFWPLSRELEPKQFLNVIGRRTLLEETIWRIRTKIKKEHVFLVTNSLYVHDVKKQIDKFNIPKENIFLEPEGKNTAPAIGWAASQIQLMDSNAIILVLPSDHIILKTRYFLRIIDKAVGLAKKDFLVTLGIVPTGPEIGYGYIKCIKRHIGKKSICTVERFIEKPSFKKANYFLKSKNYFWNSGIFIWKVSVILEQIKRYLPQLYNKLEKIKRTEDVSKIWKTIKSISIDYGVLEKSKRLVMLPTDIGWSDLGSWDALAGLLEKDKNRNVFNSDSLDIGSKNIFVWGKSRLISTIGLKDIILIDTPDALLVCRRGLSQKVKEIVEMLKRRSREERLFHRTVKRPWGAYTVLEEGDVFKIKVVEIEPKQRLSLQLHKKRAEHWVVVQGKAKVYKENKYFYVNQNESIYIPANKLHRLENPLETTLKIVEVQTGKYLKEDDIVRITDDYERVKP